MTTTPQSNSEPKLEPCPFCPHPTERYYAMRDVGWQRDRETTRRLVVVCSNCGAQGPAFGVMSFSNEDTAAQYWNSRVSASTAPVVDEDQLKVYRVALETINEAACKNECPRIARLALSYPVAASPEVQSPSVVAEVTAKQIVDKFEELRTSPSLIDVEVSYEYLRSTIASAITAASPVQANPDEDAEFESVAETAAEIKRLTAWQDLCFQLLSEIRQWVAPGSITDTDAPRVLRAMLEERARLRAASPVQASVSAEGERVKRYADALEQIRDGLFRYNMGNYEVCAKNAARMALEHAYEIVEPAATTVAPVEQSGLRSDGLIEYDLGDKVIVTRAPAPLAETEDEVKEE